jgi:hypothetical protein
MAIIRVHVEEGYDRDGIKVVPIDSVRPFSPMDPYFTRKMKLVLCRQGQIEPLQINKRRNHTYPRDVHGATIWHAAKDLGWDTLLVLFNDRYEE